jgi:holo-[acyl-carrier protein] synthase
MVSQRVGIDLVKISCIQESIDHFGDRFRMRIFTAAEIAYCRQEPHSEAERFAARFAAKEATLKVLRPTARWVDWRTIEVLRHPAGWCDLALHGDALALATEAGIASLSLSMSHEAAADVATAVVIATTEARLDD